MNKITRKISILAIPLALITFNAEAKKTSPLTVEGAKTIDVNEATALWKRGVKFIDTRKTTGGWVQGRIPDAIHLDVRKPEFNEENILKHVKKDEPVVSYCNADTCDRSSKGAKKLVEWGWKEVYYYRMGFPSWKAAGNPYE